MPSVARKAQLLNFALVGNCGSGIGALQAVLAQTPQAICHDHLFHADLTRRQQAYEAYFGPQDAALAPTWFDPTENSLWQYLNHAIWDTTLRNETAVGVVVRYPDVHQYDLYDLFESRCKEGDFCLVHVLRNPVACLVSAKQWGRTSSGSVSLDLDELVEFCRAHASMRGRLRTSCDDVLEIPYYDFVVHQQRVLRELLDFLELPVPLHPIRPPTQRFKRRTVPERVSNFASLTAKVPYDVKEFFLADDLF